MTSKGLSLLGHYNPTMEYPAEVVPICRDGQGNLVAVYLSSERRGYQTRVFPESLSFVMREAAPCPYRPKSQGLFAYSRDRIIPFLRDDESAFFRSVLKEAELAGASPFVRLSMAQRTGDAQSIRRAVRDCVLELGAREDGFLLGWYEQQYVSFPGVLQREFQELLSGAQRADVACFSGDEGLLLPLARAFNCREADPPMFVVPRVHGHADISLGELDLSQVAVLKESMSKEELYPTFGGEMVLAVNPTFARRVEVTRSDAAGILRAGLRDERFRWVRPRIEEDGSSCGELLDGAVYEALGADAEAAQASVRIERKVKRYSPVGAAADVAIPHEQQWEVDAFVTLRHTAESLAKRLPAGLRPLVVGWSDPIVVPYTIQQPYFGGHELREVHSAFLQFLTSDGGMRLLSRSGGLRVQHRHVASVQHYRAQAEALGRFQNQSHQRPVAVMLAVDSSASMEGAKLDAVKLALPAFVTGLSAERGDLVGLMRFSDSAEDLVSLARFAESVDELGVRISSLQAGGNTALLDGLARAIHHLEEVADEYIRIVVLLTDGHENASKSVTQEGVDEIVRKHRAHVFCLAYGADAEYDFLARVSARSRGAVFRGTLLSIQALYKHISRLI
jgi:uncharacterized protein YegL